MSTLGAIRHRLCRLPAALGRRGSVATAVVLVAAALPALAIAAAPPAAAAVGPASTVRYAAGATATVYSGRAFDTCTAPTLATIRAWGASPYRAIGVYIGGVDRTCAQPQLTAAWVTAVTQLGWRLIPIYKGLQAPPPCGRTDHQMNPATSNVQGTQAADDAVAQAKALGMLSGSALYNDMEAYTPGNAACSTAVLRFLSGWTSEIHRLGYVSGVYAQLDSGAHDLAGVYTSTALARPDALWIARYDGNPSLTNWVGVSTTGVPNADWAVQQRGKQYNNGHNETYGGVTINIDNDQFNAPVASVAYTYKVTSTIPTNALSGPSTSYPVVKAHAPGSALAVACQAPGQKIHTTAVWDKLTDGSYATDYYVNTPGHPGYSAPLPRCSYPYQVTAASLNERTGPGGSYALAGTLPNGGLGWVTCQQAGSLVGSTRVWDKLTDGRWVSDYYLATPSKTTYSSPVPRC